MTVRPGPTGGARRRRSLLTLRHELDGSPLDDLASDLADAVNVIGTVAVDSPDPG
ncbi:hypothetical protein [Ilumatobacter sp.]|uniref:hypothetical protein n=1 Tax=Ilumatobacter sp. TaxID=1967498 RepID=UPI003C685A62